MQQELRGSGADLRRRVSQLRKVGDMDEMLVAECVQYIKIDHPQGNQGFAGGSGPEVEETTFADHAD